MTNAKQTFRLGCTVTLALCQVFFLASCASKVLKIEHSDEILANKEYEDVIDVVALPEDQAVGDSSGGLYVRRDAPPYVPPPSEQSKLPGGALAPPVPAASEKRKGKGGKRRGPPGDIGKKTNQGPVVTPTIVTSPTTRSKSPPTSVVNGKQGAASELTATPPPAGATAAIVATNANRREPELEDSVGFIGRRPEADPFRVGEVVTIELSYFGVAAGEMTLEVRPFKQVNGRKSYSFVGTAKSSSVFSVFYAVDDWFETFVDYQDLIPYNYSLHVKESKQLREVRSYFDWKALRGYLWDKKVTNEKGVDEKKYEWSILPYAQNVFSSWFYLRTFKLEPGKNVQFRIGHEGKNLVATAEVLRRERLSTDIGELNTVVIKPRIAIDGVFKPMGDVYFWMTDDERKFIVRMEAKIKIGTVLGEVKAITPGND